MSKTRAGSGQVATNLKFEGTVGITIPTGGTAARNPSANPGEIRYNSDLGVFEGYTGTVWGAMGPYNGMTLDTYVGDGTTYVYTVSSTITSANNVMVTLNGVQMTVNIDYIIAGSNQISFTEADGNINPPLNGEELLIRNFAPITSATVPAGSITAQTLNTSNTGTTGQVLSLNSSGALTYITVPTSQPTSLTLGGALGGTTAAATINAGSIGLAQLNVSPGTYGQVLATDGAGNLVFVTQGLNFSRIVLIPQTSAPSNPAVGTVATADHATWNPASKSGTAPYPVFWDGTTWQPLY